MTAGGLRSQKKLETWRLLHDTALRLVAERGFDRVSVEDIATGARVSTRTFFNYFSTKESALFDPDPEEPLRWRTLVAARPPGEPLWTALKGICLGYVSAYEAKMTIQRELVLASGSLERPAGGSIDAFRTFLLSWAIEREEHASEPTEVVVMINAALSVIRSAFSQWDPADGYERFESLVARGFDLLGPH